MTEQPGTVDITETDASVRFERTIDAPIEHVWRALTDEGQLARWLAAGAFEAREAGALAFDFGEGGVVKGQITTWEPPRRLTYTWLIPNEPASAVAWTLEPEGTGTRLLLVHATLPARMGHGYAAGWHTYLERLDALATGGQVPEFAGRFEALLEVYAS